MSKQYYSVMSAVYASILITQGGKLVLSSGSAARDTFLGFTRIAYRFGQHNEQRTCF